MVSFDWLLFDGGVREAQTEIARSRQNEAEQAIAKLQRQAAQEVVSAYNEVNASLSRYQAAFSLAFASGQLGSSRAVPDFRE